MKWYTRNVSVLPSHHHSRARVHAIVCCEVSALPRLLLYLPKNLIRLSVCCAGEWSQCICEGWQEWALKEQCKQLLLKEDILKSSQRAGRNYIQNVPWRGNHLYAMNATTVNMHIYFFVYHIQKINETLEIDASLSVCTPCFLEYLENLVFCIFVIPNMYSLSK